MAPTTVLLHAWCWLEDVRLSKSLHSNDLRFHCAVYSQWRLGAALAHKGVKAGEYNGRPGEILIFHMTMKTALAKLSFPFYKILTKNLAPIFVEVGGRELSTRKCMGWLEQSLVYNECPINVTLALVWVAVMLGMLWIRCCNPHPTLNISPRLSEPVFLCHHLTSKTTLQNANGING